MRDLMNRYKELEFTLVTELTRLLDIAREIDLPDVESSIKSEILRVKEKTFRVIVVGEFKRGKSTLINALLKRKVLPADVVPTTATINRVAYDPNPYVRIYFKDGSEQDLDITMLSNYVTKLTPEGEAVASRINEAVIFYPTPFCQNNIYLIDTPGLCDDDTMTEVTMNAIDGADAAIMVISALSPFSQTECDFVTRLILESTSLCRLVFAVNYIDKLDEDEVDRLLEYARKRIQSTVLAEGKSRYGEDTPEFKKVASILEDAPIFGISSYLAINARTENNPKKLEQSRFQHFEEELENILATEQGLSAIRIPFEKMIYSCDKIIDKIQSNLSNNENKYNGESNSFFSFIGENERGMHKLLEEIRSSVQPAIQKIHNLCTMFQIELYQNGLACFERAGINDINFQMNYIDSYFKYLNDAISNFEKSVSGNHMVRIRTDIIKAFTDYIYRLNLNYNNIRDEAKMQNITIIDRLEQRNFMYWMQKYPFPEYCTGFMLPTDISVNSMSRDRFSGLLTAYLFRVNMPGYWGQLVSTSMGLYKNQMCHIYQLLVQDITNDYQKNFDNMLLQIRSGYSAQLGFSREKIAALKSEYEKKMETVKDIRSKSSMLLEAVKNKNMDL